MMSRPRSSDDGSLEDSIAWLLSVGTYASVALLLIGTVLLLVEGRSPLDLGPAFDPATIVTDVAALRSAGFLWLGILGLVATPSARVVAALVGYARRGDPRMAGVAALIIVVLATGVIAGLAGG